MGKYQILDLAAILTLNDLYTSWNRVCHVFSILKDKSLPDQHSDTEVVAYNEPWAILWSIPLPPIPSFLNICVL